MAVEPKASYDAIVTRACDLCDVSEADVMTGTVWQFDGGLLETGAVLRGTSMTTL